MAEKTEKILEETTVESREMPDIDSKYRMIILAAQRSKQIQRGATPRIDMEVRLHKPTRIAMKELDAGKVYFDVTKDKKQEA